MNYEIKNVKIDIPNWKIEIGGVSMKALIVSGIVTVIVLLLRK
jgi:hypothetical protein